MDQVDSGAAYVCQSISTCYYIMLDLCTVPTPVLNIMVSIDGDA